MITQEQFDHEVKMIIANAIREDVGDGDHSSLACIPANARGRAKILVKDCKKGIRLCRQKFKIRYSYRRRLRSNLR